jgi:hypothetical protein
MKKPIKYLAIILPIVIVIGFLVFYYFPYDSIKIDPADQACQVDDDCIMAMVRCSCDCGQPINEMHWEKYLNKQQRMCKFYSGEMCKMVCAENLKCINNICTIVK